MYFSPSTVGFYAKEIHGDSIPRDAVELTEAEYTALLEGQSRGSIISADENGSPILTDPPAPTDDQRATSIRAKRDALMADFQWRIERYNSEVRLGMKPTDDIAVLDAYMQALRDVTKQATFPTTIAWPDIPL